MPRRHTPFIKAPSRAKLGEWNLANSLPNGAKVRLASAKPRTEEEKAKAYGDDLIAQIGQADAMDERLAQKIKNGQSW